MIYLLLALALWGLAGWNFYFVFDGVAKPVDAISWVAVMMCICMGTYFLLKEVKDE